MPSLMLQNNHDFKPALYFIKLESHLLCGTQMPHMGVIVSKAARGMTNATMVSKVTVTTIQPSYPA